MAVDRLVCSTSVEYVEPTVFADVDNKMTIAQEEIFGPVLSVIPYDTVEQAVDMGSTATTAWPVRCGRRDVRPRLRDRDADSHRHLWHQLVCLRHGITFGWTSSALASVAKTVRKVSQRSVS